MKPREHTSDVDAERRERLLAARDRLVVVLSDIAELAGAQALQRCPYRTKDDVCTFSGGCRNQLRREAGIIRCRGGRLNPLPANSDRATGSLELG